MDLVDLDGPIGVGGDLDLDLDLAPDIGCTHPMMNWKIWKVAMRLHRPSATTVSIDAVLCSLLVMGAATEACSREGE